MKTAALLGMLSVVHQLPAGARLLCSTGQEVAAGAPIAEYRATRKVRAVPLKYLEGAAVGDQIPAGTTVGGEGGWRGRRKVIDWDARVVALNQAGGQAFLSGPEIRSEIRARIGGVVGPVESARVVEVTGEGLALYCPLARGPDVFGRLALHGGDHDEPPEAYPEATVLVANSDFEPGGLASPWPENLAGLLLPGLPRSWLAEDPGFITSGDRSGPASITYAVVEAVQPSALPEPLWSALAALSGSPVSLTVDPETGTGELVVSGSAGGVEIDCGAIRGFGPDGIVIGQQNVPGDGRDVRIAGGRLLAGIQVRVGQETRALAVVNAEKVISIES